jgi:phospholipid-binding lipoprotein MlaA
MNNRGMRRWLSVLCLLCSAFVGGCATTSDTVNTGNDPWQPANRPVYNFNDKLDKYVLEPVAKKYDEFTPRLMREGITNFFDNVQYLNVILNDLLQGKVKQGFSDLGRVTVNTTLGIGGLMDLATPMGLAKHDEDFGQTLGTWGAGEGRYLVLPFAGPNSVRDAPDFITSTLLNPLTYIGGVVLLPVGALGVINSRANLLDATRIRDEAALDPYTFVREAYRQRRTSLIYDGDPPPEQFEFEDTDAPRDELKVE